jgi:hypothetical protein
MTYYKVSVAADRINNAAAFEDEETAKQILDIFNDRYEGSYEMEETENATTIEISNALIIRSLEGI